MRELDVFADGHIPGSVAFPDLSFPMVLDISRSSQSWEYLEKIIKKSEMEEKTLALCCHGSIFASPLLVRKLRRMGVPAVYIEFRRSFGQSQGHPYAGGPRGGHCRVLDPGRGRKRRQLLPRGRSARRPIHSVVGTTPDSCNHFGGCHVAGSQATRPTRPGDS